MELSEYGFDSITFTQFTNKLNDEYNLDEFGISAKVIHTPDHTAGSISIIMNNGEAIIGDLVRGNHRINLGAFYEDKIILLNPS